ncbi:MAG: DUF134 domain-containing protein [Oscillospiraceae bacterium]
MPRPVKCRKVCCLPKCSRFGPLDAPECCEKGVEMTVVEYEAIRLIDLEGFTQEECAEQMSVARTTVQGIYIDARKKLAESLVNGKTLIISGGNYLLCQGQEEFCRCGGCCRHRRNRDLLSNEDTNPQK